MVLGKVRRIDLGRANGRYFLLMAGLGFDAEVVHAVEGAPKQRFGPVAFFVAGVMAALRTHGSQLRIRADGRTFETSAALMTIGNTRLWAGAVKITNRRHRRRRPVGRLLLPRPFVLAGRCGTSRLVLIGRHEQDPDVTYMQVRELLVAARPPLPLHLDGEPFGTTPARVEVVPGAIRRWSARAGRPSWPTPQPPPCSGQHRSQRSRLDPRSAPSAPPRPRAGEGGRG